MRGDTVGTAVEVNNLKGFYTMEDVAGGEIPYATITITGIILASAGDEFWVKTSYNAGGSGVINITSGNTGISILSLEGSPGVTGPTGAGVSTVETLEPIYGDGSSGSPALPVTLSYHTGDFALTGSNLSGGATGIMLNLDFTTLPSPSIAANWAVRKNDNTTPFPTTSFQNGNTVQSTMSGAITVPVGSKVDLTSGIATIAALGGGQQGPTTVTGSFTFVPSPPSSLPASSTTLTATNLASTTTYSISMTKPKSGLEVSAGRVVRASGNDSASSSITVTFSNVFYYGYLVVGPPLTPITQPEVDAITAGEIEGLANLRFGGRAQTFSSNDLTPSGNRLVFAYPASLGDVNTLTAGSPLDHLGAFTRCTTPIHITTVSGATISYIYYVANAANSWNETITTS